MKPEQDAKESCINVLIAVGQRRTGVGSGGEKKGIHDLANCKLNCSVEQRRKSGQVLYWVAHRLVG